MPFLAPHVEHSAYETTRPCQPTHLIGLLQTPGHLIGWEIPTHGFLATNHKPMDFWKNPSLHVPGSTPNRTPADRPEKRARTGKHLLDRFQSTAQAFVLLRAVILLFRLPKAMQVFKIKTDCSARTSFLLLMHWMHCRTASTKSQNENHVVKGKIDRKNYFYPTPSHN